jgi:hypothetical protein
MTISVLGWAIRDWSIRPSMLLIINLIDFRLNRDIPTRLRLGKLLFSRPSKIQFSRLDRSTGPEWFIEDFACEEPRPGLVVCNVHVVGSGLIEIHAQELCNFFW